MSDRTYANLNTPELIGEIMKEEVRTRGDSYKSNYLIEMEIELSDREVQKNTIIYNGVTYITISPNR